MNDIDIEAKGSKGGLSLAWKGELTVVLKSFSKWHIDVMIKEKDAQEAWRFTGFYGSPYSNNKRTSWDLLRKLGQDQDLPWIVWGLQQNYVFFREN